MVRSRVQQLSQQAGGALRIRAGLGKLTQGTEALGLVQAAGELEGEGNGGGDHACALSMNCMSRSGVLSS